MESSAQAFLLATQNTDGGWGYAPGAGSTVEATSAVTLALAPADGAADAYRRGAAWLIWAQHPDGGWGFTRDDGFSGWQSAWAVWALTKTASGAAQAAHGAAWLLNVQLARVETPEDVNWVQVTFGIDPSLRGWPWYPGEASWVEPTALALLALAPQAAVPAVAPRLDEAMRYLQDRRCQGGGWNVGNPVMFSRPLPARACPTSWVLLAMASVAPNAVQADDLAVLRAEMHADDGASALGWGLLALRTLGDDDPPAADRLRGRQAADGGWDANPYHTAVAAMALQGHI